jgi:hypothetical protein
MPKGTRKQPTQEMVNAIIAACDYKDCDHAFCAPDHLEFVKDYSIRVTKSCETMDGYYWEGTIYHGEKPIIFVYNEGCGGPNIYWQKDGLDASVVDDFSAAAKAAFPRLEFEPEEALTSFLDMCFQNFNPKKVK